MEEQYVLSVLVKNSSGVLSRVSGLFSRRGYNIDSLTVGRTENKEISRMTICNSKFLGEPIHEYTNNPPYCTVDNVEIIEWNNTKLSN